MKTWGCPSEATTVHRCLWWSSRITSDSQGDQPPGSQGHSWHPDHCRGGPLPPRKGRRRIAGQHHLAGNSSSFAAEQFCTRSPCKLCEDGVLVLVHIAIPGAKQVERKWETTHQSIWELQLPGWEFGNVWAQKQFRSFLLSTLDLAACSHGSHSCQWYRRIINNVLHLSWHPTSSSQALLPATMLWVKNLGCPCWVYWCASPWHTLTWWTNLLGRSLTATNSLLACVLATESTSKTKGNMWCLPNAKKRRRIPVLESAHTMSSDPSSAGSGGCESQ